MAQAHTARRYPYQASRDPRWDVIATERQGQPITARQLYAEACSPIPDGQERRPWTAAEYAAWQVENRVPARVYTLAQVHELTGR